MAISKNQPMRPALNDVLDAYGTMESDVARHTAQIGALQETATDHGGRIAELETGLSDEAQSRITADTTITQALHTEVQARTDADTALGDRIDSETQARTADDTALATQIQDEGQARQAADTALSVRISELEAGLPQLAARVAANESAIGTLEEQVSAWRKGMVGPLTVVAGTPSTGTVTLAEPFESIDMCGTFLTFVGAPVADVTLAVTACDPTGFSYEVTNAGALDTQVTFGYVQVSFDKVIGA